MVKPKYVQFVLDFLLRDNKQRIVKREILLDVFEKAFNFNDREKADLALSQVLRRLVQQGVITERARGFYHYPPSPTAVGVRGVEEAVADLGTVHDLYKKKVG